MFKSPTSEQNEKYHSHSRSLSIGIRPDSGPILADFDRFWPILTDLGQFAPVLVVRHLAADCLGIEPGNCSGDWPWARHVAVVD